MWQSFCLIAFILFRYQTFGLQYAPNMSFHSVSCQIIEIKLPLALFERMIQ